MSEESSAPVLTDVNGPVLIITLNRPEAKNAANLALAQGVAAAIDRRGFAGLTEALPKKPLIAAVDGFALAGGMEIALSCDMIVANRKAKFGIPEVKRGLAAAAGGLIRMPRQMPFRVAMEYALTGEFFDAERAYELGIINRVTDGPALEAALVLAAAIDANGPLAVKASKQVAVESRLWPEDQMWKKQQEIVAHVFTSEDAREGAAAFAQKRAPNWKASKADIEARMKDMQRKPSLKT